MSVSILLFGWQTDRLESINWGSSLQHALIKGVVAIIQEHYYRVEMWQWQKKNVTMVRLVGEILKLSKE